MQNRQIWVRFFLGLCIGEFLLGSLTWKTGLCKCGIVRSPHMQGLWALPRSKQSGLPSLFCFSVVDPVGHKCLQTAKSHSSVVQAFSTKVQQQGASLFRSCAFLACTQWLCILYFHLCPIFLINCQSPSTLLTSAATYYDCYLSLHEQSFTPIKILPGFWLLNAKRCNLRYDSYFSLFVLHYHATYSIVNTFPALFNLLGMNMFNNSYLK